MRASGMPKQAFLIAGHEFGGAHWESLPAALKRGHADAVIVRQVAWSISGVDNRREHLAGGRTQSRMLVNPWLAQGRSKAS